MKLSFFHSDITPPIGHPLCAGWYPPSTAIADCLSANGILLSFDDQLPVVLCALDWAEMSNGEYRLWQEGIAEATGTKPDRVAIHCVHAHDAPWPDREAQALLDQANACCRIMDVEWCEKVRRSVAASARAALENAQEVTDIRLGKAKVPQIASNRRVLGPDGKVKGVRWTRCNNAELRAEPEGEIDPYLKTISFWSESRKIAALHFYAVHPTSYDGTGVVTTDFVGIARDRLTKEDGVPHLYFTECAGNITPGKYNDGIADNRELFTERVFNAMRASESYAEVHPLSSLEWRTSEVILPPREDLTEAALLETIQSASSTTQAKSRAAVALIYRRRCEGKIPITISALHLGGAFILLSLPGEAFIEYQLYAQDLAPNAMVVTPAYGDCGPGYIPLSRSYEEGGYEPSDAFCSPESETILCNAIQKLLNHPANRFEPPSISIARTQA